MSSIKTRPDYFQDMNYDLLIFDMDGVVIDSGPLFDRVDAEFFARRNLKYNQGDIRDLVSGVYFTQGMKLLKEAYNIDGHIDDLLQERGDLLEAEYLTSLEYILGFEDFFQNVIKSEFKFCIATSSTDRHLELANERLDLKAKFGDNIYKASDVGHASKPDPAVFLHAAKQMGVLPERCIVIEDAQKGVEAAKRAGMFCIGITTTVSKDKLAKADLVVDSFDELDLNAL